MNKKMFLIVILTIIISLIIGIIIGFFIPKNSKPSIVGTYTTTTWNGKEGTLIINSDGTLCMPSAEILNWSLDGNKLILSNGNTMTVMENGITFSGHVFSKK